jgi:AmiR/NasT family two-component response regulator
MGDPITFLIVDDNALFRHSTARILKALGFAVVGEAADGHCAVDLVQTLHPDLVLMDIEMPAMDGIEAAREIQRVCPTPVILLTAHDSQELLHNARAAGVAAYLVKPLDSRELQRTATIALARFEDWKALKRAYEELAKRNEQLQKALGAIKTLKGLLPICAWCGRKIENEPGQWVTLESYIESHSDAQFTHGICPECLRKMRSGEEG